MFALFDQEKSRVSFLEQPKLYKIGLRSQCFSTPVFWKWIFYGIAQSALVWSVAFLTYNYSANTEQGMTGDLWLEGTFAYGAIVILANMTILYASASHNFFSLFLIFGSVSAFFVLFFVFSFVKLSTLDHLFAEIVTYPTTAFNVALFFLFSFPVDCFLNFISTRTRVREEVSEKERKKEEKKKFVKGLDPTKLAPIHRRKIYN